MKTESEIRQSHDHKDTKAVQVQLLFMPCNPAIYTAGQCGTSLYRRPNHLWGLCTAQMY